MFRRMLKQARGAAFRKGFDFDLQVEDLYNLWQVQLGRCNLSGFPLKFGETRSLQESGHNTASLDRKDASRGYVRDNIQIVHKDINFLKNDFPDDLFIYICRCVAEHTKDRVIAEPKTLDSHRWPKYTKLTPVEAQLNENPF